METATITQILTIFLAVSVIILFILIVLFFALWLKRRERKQTAEDLTENKNQSKIESKIIETKQYSTENIKKFMDFDEIKDNMIVQKNGKRFVMVIQCQGINYDLMSSIEKVGVEQGFIQFLNTLTKPIQIYVQSRKVNLEESIENYRKKLKKET